MRFWLSLNFERSEDLVEHARAAEQLGYEGVLLPDHIVVPTGAFTPHPAGYPLKANEPFPEPIIAFSVMAGATTTLRFLSGVLVVPLRDPYLLAKQLGTLAALSGDRVVLGTGTGWLKEEFEIVGQGFSDRGSRMDEMLDLMVDFWQDGYAEKHGRHYDLGHSGMFPVPTKPVPVWIGGMTPPAVRRAARFDGYMPMRLHDEQSVAEFAEIDRLRAEQARSGPFARVTYWAEGDRGTAEKLAEDGITDVVVQAWEYYASQTLKEKHSAAEAFTTEIFI
jgi:probable F420-dependent oxidoreductase